MKISPIFAIDGYKLSHRQQYPNNTTRIFGNFTPRSNKHFKSPFFNGKAGSPLIWAGMQAFLLQWLVDEFKDGFFDKPKEEVVGQMKAFCDRYIGKDQVPVDGIAALHDLGYLPVRIKSIPEGSVVQIGTPVLTIINTDDRFFWLVNYLETLMSAELWPVATAATIAFNYRCIGELWAEKTCDDKGHIPYQFHDFSARGDMGMWACTLVGMGHLMSFEGSDSVYACIRIAEQYKAAVGASIPATEHSVMCMGEKESELETFRRLIEEIYPNGYVGIVSDTWNLWTVLMQYAPQLRDKIEARDGKVVFRPDSGNPVDIICGRPIIDCKKCQHMGQVQTTAFNHINKNEKSSAVFLFKGEYFEPFRNNENCYELRKVPEHVVKGAIELLWDGFGGTVNKKGYKLLNPKVGLIYGDSITLEIADQIFKRLSLKGFASSNVVLGIGSYTYQYITRDTFGFAMKATWGIVNGVPREIFKDPITDDGTKKSLKGLIHHQCAEGGQWIATDQVSMDVENTTDLVTCFENGKVFEDTLPAIRKRIDAAVNSAVTAKLK